MKLKYKVLLCIKRIKKHFLYRILDSFKAFFILIAFYITYFPISFSPPDLEVKYEMFSLLSDINSSNKNTEINRSDLLVFYLYNNSNKALTNVEVNLIGFKYIDKIFTSSNSTRIMSNSKDITKYKRLKSGLVFFPNITTIPPKTQISLEVWGKIVPIFPFPGHPIVIKSSATETEITESTRISGPSVFIVDNLIPISAFIAFIFFLIGAKKFSRPNN